MRGLRPAAPTPSPHEEFCVRRRFLLPAMALLLPLLLAPAVAATSGQTADSLGQTVGWNVAISPTNLLAQTFTTPNKVERLDYIEVFLHGSTNGAVVDAWVKAGAPATTGIAGTDATVNVGAGFTNNWVTLTPATSITLAANSQYSVMFRVTDATNTTTVAGENHAEYYPDGAAYGYDGATWTTPAPGDSQDLAFQVFMSPVPGTTDQHQNAHGTPIGISVTAQTFVAGVTGTLNAVSLWSAGTDGTQNVTVEICSTANGIDCAGPASGVVANPALDPGVLASAAVGVNHGDGQWTDFVFSSPPSIVAGTMYAIVVLGDAGWSGVASNAYGPGVGFFYEAGWSSMNGAPVFDLAFQTFVTAAALPTPPPSGATPLPSGATPLPSTATPPPTSTGAAAADSGGPAPLPTLLTLTVALSTAAIVLARRYGIISRR